MIVKASKNRTPPGLCHKKMDKLGSPRRRSYQYNTRCLTLQRPTPRGQMFRDHPLRVTILANQKINIYF